MIPLEAPPSGAPSPVSRQWGLHTGDVLGGGDNLLLLEAGWPDASLGFVHGFGPVDLGAVASFVYGAGAKDTQVGLGLRLPIRVGITKGDAFSALFHVDPGARLPTIGASSGTSFALQMPLGFELGFHPSSSATIALGVDVHTLLNLTGGKSGLAGTYLIAQPMGGAGFELHVRDDVAIGLNSRFGAPIVYQGSIAGGGFAYWALLGFGYRL